MSKNELTVHSPQEDYTWCEKCALIMKYGEIFE